MAQLVVGGRRRTLWGAIVLLIAIVLVFVGIRLATDVPDIVAGDVPGPDAFERRYVLHPLTAYLHIVPGVVYLLLAPFQLWRRFRTRHLRLHRLMGRVALPAGLVAGVLALVFGTLYPYGGPVEAAAAVVFGLAFLAELTLAYAAVRRKDITAHRRWMIRAFAVAVGIGTIRIWVGLFQATGLLAIQDGTGTVWFGVAFWLAFLMHAAAGELYLRARPAATGVARSRATPRPA